MSTHTQGAAEWVPTRDGRELYAMVLPGPDAHAPTVVFEAGSGANRSSWALVQPAVAEFARAVVYDRSGLGRSARDPSSRALSRMAEDLSDLLDHFGSGPFILVGWSAGGPIVRATAALQSDRITGVVLVDPTDEAAEILFSRRFRQTEKVALRAGLQLARAGLLGRIYASVYRSIPLSDDVRHDLNTEGFTPGVLQTQIAQSRTYLDELQVFRSNPPELGPIPVTVISGARTGDGMNAVTRAAANASHAHRAAQSPAGRHVIAHDSGHYVPLTEPTVVIGEIRRLAA